MQTCRKAGRYHLALLAFTALLFSSCVFAEPAARVEFALGNVTAAGGDGHVRTLAKGAAVAAGETVSTNEGRAQLRFTDDGMVSLHSQSVFRVEQYRWSGATDGSEHAIFRLLKGGLRTITGKLSKINRKAYQMHTIVATIGIRGTEYTMQLNGDLSGSVAEGEIEVCNAGGCLAVAAGQSYQVLDTNTKPVFSNKHTYLPPPQPDATKSNATSGGVVNTLDAAATGLLNPVATAPGSLATLTNGTTNSLLGGTTLVQPVQGVVGTIGGTTGVPPGSIPATNGLPGIIRLGF